MFIRTFDAEVVNRTAPFIFELLLSCGARDRFPHTDIQSVLYLRTHLYQSPYFDSTEYFDFPKPKARCPASTTCMRLTRPLEHSNWPQLNSTQLHTRQFGFWILGTPHPTLPKFWAPKDENSKFIIFFKFFGWRIEKSAVNGIPYTVPCCKKSRLIRTPSLLGRRSFNLSCIIHEADYGQAVDRYLKCFINWPAALPPHTILVRILEITRRTARNNWDTVDSKIGFHSNEIQNIQIF